MRILFYSHDAVGLGHVRRHLAIAAAVNEACPDAKMLVATSVDEVCRLGLPPNVDTLKLPALRKVSNRQYASRRLGLSPSEIHDLRSALLVAAVETFKPTIVVADKHPLGAGGEFKAALERAKGYGARAVLGMRDILDEPSAVQHEWAAGKIHERIIEYYDQVLVYGAASIFDPVKEYRFPAALTERTKFCGYVVNPPPRECQPELCLQPLPSRSNGHPRVLGTTGGGEDGFALLATFIRAAKDASWEGVAVAGPMASPPSLSALKNLSAANGVTLHPFIPCLSNLFGSLDGLVCMGGYNTLVEALSQGVPTVCVPRNVPRSEQLLRARAFEKLGLMRCIAPEQLTVEKLRLEVTAAFKDSRQTRIERANNAFSFDGARRAAAHLLALGTPIVREQKRRLEQMRS